MTIYDYDVINVKGEKVSLSNFKGRVMLIVNTATGCGFTPQYDDLEKIYKKYHEKGLELIDIPCNQFLGQTPGTDEEIHEFCALNFGTTFPHMKKSEVNGEGALPLYGFLKEKQGFAGFTGPKAGIMDELLEKIDKDYKNNPNIKWNFTKFVIDREGNVVKRFEPTDDMAEVDKLIGELI